MTGNDVVDFDLRNFAEALQRRTWEQPEKTAYLFLKDGEIETAQLSYAELDRRARSIAAAMQDEGLEGERALLLYPAGLEFVSAFCGCLIGGVVAVPTYPPGPRRALPRLRAIVREARPRIVLTTAEIYSRREAVVAGIPELEGLRWLATDGLSEELALGWRPPALSGETLAFLQFTSGSTAAPKGVMVSHRNLLHNEEMMRQAFGQSEESVIVSWLPVYHDMGLIGCVLQPLFVGARCVLMAPQAFLQRPRRWLEALSRYRATTSGGPDFAYELCVRRIEPQQRQGLDLSSWEVAFSGSEPVRARTLRRFAEAFAPCGFRRQAFFPCYGLAEATLFVTGGSRTRAPVVNRVDSTSLERNEVIPAGPATAAPAPGRELVGCGRSWLGQEVLIVDPETREPSRPGRVGEIWVAGPSVAGGYWQRPEATREAFQARLARAPDAGAFLRTGDLGAFVDAQLLITGRLKDLVIIRGRNLYPQDLELTAERSHPALRPGGGAAFSVEVGGEERLVIVHERERRFRGETEEVAEAVRRAVAEEHEVSVHEVVLLATATLPKTTSGKIRRRACRDRYLAGELSAVGRSVLEESLSEVVESPRSLRRDALLCLDREERRPLLESYLRERAALALHLPAARLDPGQALTGLGLDSLTALELSHRIASELGTSPSSISFLQGRTIAELAAELARGVEHPPGEEVPDHAPAADPDEELRLSYGQRALWFLQRLAPESAAYNIIAAARLRQRLDATALRRAFQALIGRHPVLRSQIETGDGEPRRRVREEMAVPWVHEDASQWPAGVVNDRLHAEAYQAFDPEAGPLLRVRLWSRSPGDHLLLLVVHHTVADFWSLAVMTRELAALYQREKGEPAAVPEAPRRSYSDYVRWQRSMLSGPRGEELRSYWCELLDGTPPVLELPTDRPRPPIQSYRGAAVAGSLDRELSARVTTLARSSGATVYMVLLAAFQTLLQRYCGQQALLVGSPTSGRHAVEFEGTVGYFVNPVVLRAELGGNPSFRSFLARTRQSVLDAFAHQDYPFPLLAERLQPERDPSRSPLFQVMFVLQKAPRDAEAGLAAFALGHEGMRIELGGLVVESMRVEERASQFDLTLRMAQLEGTLAGSLLYNTDLFDATTMRRFWGHFRSLLAAAVTDSDELLSALPLLSGAEGAQLLVEWNVTRTRWPADLCLHELVAAQVEQTPAAVAVICGGEELSYGELNRRANRLAHDLRSLAVGPEVRVGVTLERSPEMVVAALAILKAGGVWVPLDPAYPRERQRFMLRDCGAALLVTAGERGEGLAGDGVRILRLDEERAAIHRRSAENPASGIGTDNAAYVIYTSGSTGIPKGVLVSHRAIANRLRWGQSLYPLGGEDRVLQSAGLGFDFAVWELFAPLACGAQVVLPGASDRDLGALSELIRRRGVTVAHFVPSALGAFLAQEGVERCDRLRLVFSGGEALGPELAEAVLARLPVELINQYGPTEASVDATFHRCRPAGRSAAPVPIGRPIANTRVRLLDRDLRPVPCGVGGELCIGGVGLARGYLGRPALNAERFIPDPFARRAGARLYRTGDLARWRPDGELDFLGRLDHQVKIRGFRIELGEIEVALSRHPEVREAVVLSRADEREGAGRAPARLVAYWVAQAEDRAPAISDLRAFLATRLPAYMVPSAFVRRATLPLTPNGKVDRRALPAPEAARPELDSAFVGPRNPIEAGLAEIWAEVLGIERVGVNDNFFALGGDSILSIQAVSRACRAGLRLAPRQLFAHQTVAELAPQVNTAAAAEAEQGAVIGPLPLTPIQQGFLASQPVDPHHFNQALMLAVRDRIEPQLLARALAGLVAHHDALRLRFALRETGWRQINAAPGGAVPFAGVDLSALPEPARDEAMAAAAARAQASLDPERGPLLRMVLFERGRSGTARLLWIVHHLAVDGVSWRVLLEDLETGYRHLVRGERLGLPAKTSSYRAWAEALAAHAASDQLAAEADYWVAAAQRPRSPLPVDRPGGANIVASTRAVRVGLSADQTRALLHEVPQAYRTEINDVLLAALARTLTEWSGERDVVVDLEGHGREAVIEGPDLSRTVGWFTSIYPVRPEVADAGDPGALLKAVKEQLRQVPSRGLGYGLLRYSGRLRSQPPAEVSFNYLGQLDQGLSSSSPFVLAAESAGPSRSPRARRSRLLEITAGVSGGRLQLSWAYGAELHERATIEALAQRFVAVLGELIEHCCSPRAGGYTPSDFPLAGLGQAALDALVGRERGIEDLYPLAPMQQGILFHALEAPGSELYFQQLSGTLEGRLEVAAFHRAWRRVVQRHPVLRTAFVWEGPERPLQIVYRGVELPWQEQDWRGIARDEQEERLAEFLRADRARGFELRQAPLMRIALIRRGAESWQLVWSHHHLLFDGWSLTRLMDEVLIAYQALLAGREPQLPRVRPFGEYVGWLRRQDPAPAEIFWRQALRGFAAPITVRQIGGRERPAGTEPSCVERRLRLSATRTGALGAMARRHQLTLSTLVHGAWAVLLGRYSGKRTVVFGGVSAGRPAALEGVGEMAGLFINTLPVRLELPPGTGVLPWLGQLQARQAEARQYEYAAISEVQSWSELPPGRALFETILVFENYPVSEAIARRVAGLEIRGVDLTESSNYPLNLVAGPGRELLLRLVFDPACFDSSTATRMLGHLRALLGGLIAEPAGDLENLPLLSVAERHQALVEWNASARPYPRGACVHELFAARVRLTPDTVAVQFAEIGVSYLELDARAERLAGRLQALGVGVGTLVGLFAERSVEMIVALLGVLKAGGAYVPFDVSYPPQLLAFMLEDAAAPVVLAQPHLIPRLPAEHRARVVTLTEEGSAAAAPGRRAEDPGADGLAYVMYTSGSTGRPKGVSVPHRAIVRLVRGARYVEFNPDQVFLQVSPIAFDASTFEIWGALVHGARLVMMPPATPSLEELAEALARHRVTAIFLTTSLFHLMAQEQPQAFASLRRLLTGGEVVSPRHVRRVLEQSPGMALVHAYGPTENTTFTTCFPMTEPRRVDSPLSLGGPIANTRLRLLDARQRPVPITVAAEVYVGGDGLAQGYLKRPGLTAERFVPDGLSTESGARLYRTGDQGRYRPDGGVEFLGRVDHQVKISGFRIEPGEIEVVLGQHPAVREVVVIARSSDPDASPGDGERVRGLVAYIVADQENAPSIGELKGFLGERLPEYMVPAAFVLLEQMPLTPNGKVDRGALPAPEPIPRPAQGASVAPRNPIEERLAAIWAEVLGVRSIGVEENFFELGGDSILAIQVVSRARQAGLRLTPRQLFEHQSVAELAPVVTPAAAGADQGAVSGPLPLTPIQHWFLDPDPAAPEHFNQTLLLELRRPLRPDLLARAVTSLSAHHDALRLRFERREAGWEQINAAPGASVPVPQIDLSHLAASAPEAALERVATQIQASLHLARGPLLRLALFELGSGKAARLLWVIHHLTVDAVSWRILLADLVRGYEQLARGKAVALPPKSTSFQHWARALEAHVGSGAPADEAAFWIGERWARGADLPVDHPGGANTEGSAAAVTVALAGEQTRHLLQAVPKVYRTEINDVLLTALAQTLRRWTGKSVVIDLEGHGREEIIEDVDLSRTVGWFTTIYPVLLAVEEGMGPGAALKSVKEQLRAVPGRGIGYGLLRYLSGDKRLRSLPRPQLSFNYLGQLDQALPASGPFALTRESSGPVRSPRADRRHLIEVGGRVHGGCLQLAWNYSENLHDRTTIEWLAECFLSALRALIDHCCSPRAGGYTPSDFPLAALDQEQLDRLLGARRGVEDLYPLSPTQQGILFHALDAPERRVYFNQLTCTLNGPLDRSALAAAWQQALELHPSLRSGFVWEGLAEPLQVVRLRVRLEPEELDWHGLSAAEQAERLSAWLEADRERSFDLTRAPLMRLTLMRLAEERYRFVWSYHHLLLDGWSCARLLRQIFEIYELRRSDREPRLGRPRPYRDYVAWLKRQDLQRAETFWRRTLRGFREPTVPAVGHERTSSSGAHQAECSVLLSASSTTALEALAHRHQLTLNTLLQGAWALLLSRYAGQAEVVFGAVSSGRPADLEGVDEIVGLFINTLPVRARISPARPLVGWLQELLAQQLAAREYEYTPLHQVQKWSEVPAGSPLFESILVFENYPLDEALLEWSGSLKVHDFRSNERTNYPLTLLVVPRTRLAVRINYDADRLDATIVRRMLEHLRTLLAGMAAEPARQLGSLPWLAAAERHQLLCEWSPAPVGERRDRCLHEPFAARAQECPEAIAAIDGDQRLSYRELDLRANRLAWYLVARGVGPEALVALAIERSLDLLVAILAVLKAGGAYVPLEPEAPQERLAFVVDDSGASLLLTRRRDAGDALGVAASRLVCLDEEREAIAGQSPESPAGHAAPANPAYVIYTSGSTGKPKGVAVTHTNVMRLFEATEAWFRFGGDDVWTLFHSCAFDLSVWEIWGALLYGGRVVVVPYPVSRAPEELYQLLVRERVTMLTQTPSAFRPLIPAAEAAPVDSGLALRCVIFGGESLEVESLRRWLDRYGDERPQLVNMYGITETTVHSTYRPLGRTDLDQGLGSVIGIAIPDLTVRVVDERLRPLPIGIPGELLVGGAGLARGYLGRPQLTAERFVPDPFGASPGARLYRSGDFARWLPSGEPEYLGRIDHQVKIRGFRVELGEIEVALSRHPEVREAVVVARAHEDGARPPGAERLVAYWVPRAPARAPTLSELREFLALSLPDYMVPAAFVQLASLPLTANGKVDRRALPAPESARPDLEAAFVAPRNPLEDRLAAIWAEVLGLERVGVHDNFFELGGDSILSIQVVSRASQVGLRLVPRQLFEHSTVAELAPRADIAPGVEAEQGAVTGPLPLTPIQRWFFERQPVDPHHFNQALLLAVGDDLDPGLVERALEDLLLHHDALRLRFTRRGPDWRQVNAAPGEAVPFTQVDLAALPAAARDAALAAAAALVQGSLDLGRGPLLRVVWFARGPGCAGRLLWVVHHLAVDAVSWRVLLADLVTAGGRLGRGESPRLPAKTSSFRRWAEALAAYAGSAALAAELGTWQAQGQRSGARLPLDRPGGANLVASTRSVEVSLSSEETRALLREVPNAYRTEINDVLLAALAHALAKWSGETDVRIDLEGHGREAVVEGLDLSRTVGWFTSLYPVRLEVGEEDPGELLKSVKEQLRQLPWRGVGYGVLRYLGRPEMAEPLRAQPPAEVVFNYLGQLGQGLSDASPFTLAPESAGPAHSPRAQRSHLLEVSGRVAGARLELSWKYSENLHQRSTIEAVVKRFLATLGRLIEHCRSPRAGGYTPSDFPLAALDQRRLDALLGRARGIEDVYPLSAMQQGLLFHTLEAPGSGVYFEQLWCTLRGQLDVAAFRQTWQQVMMRHPVLRTAFVWEGLDEPLQVSRRRVELPWVEEDWRDRPAPERERALTSLLRSDRERGFELSQAPLMRLVLIRLATDAWQLIWSHHHLVLDGWSRSLVLREIFASYQAAHEGREPAAGGPRPYRSYVAWLRQQDLSRAEAFWRRTLAGVEAPTPLGPAAGDGAAGEPEFTSASIRLEERLTSALAARAGGHQLTVNTLLQGTWALLLSRLGGEEDVVFGVVSSGRPAELSGIDEMVGLFINTLPARVKLPPPMSLLAVLQELQAQQLEMRGYEYSPLRELRQWSQVPAGLPLFESILVFENYPVDSSLGEALTRDLEVREVQFTQATHYPLELVALPGPRLRLQLTYDRRRFDAATVGSILSQLEALLEQFAADLERPVGSYSLLTPAARALLPDPSAALPEPRFEPLAESFAAWVRRTPEQIAVGWDAGSRSYRELASSAGALARLLIGQGIGRGEVVAVTGRRSFGLVAGILAVLSGGAVLLTLDRHLPRRRRNLMLREAGAVALLHVGPVPEGLELAGLETLEVAADSGRAIVAEPTPEGELPALTPDDPAYVFFTSGTTGRPRGVLGCHKGLSHFLDWQRRTFTLSPGDRCAQLIGLSFDAVLRDLFLPLTSGATLCLPPADELVADRVLPWLESARITLLHTVPAVVRSWLSHAPAGISLRSLRCVFFAGEPLTETLVRRFRETFPEAGELVNFYGATETTLIKCFFRVPAVPPAGVQPVGRPLPQTQALVLAPGDRRCGIGEVGEIYVRTPFRTLGYVNAPAETERRFVSNPFGEQAGDLLYRTGDRGRYRADGLLEFLGRLDEQLKVRGVRVEPGEVEAVLGQHPAVRESVVVGHPAGDGERCLVAYVVADDGAAQGDALRRFLAQRLPPQIVPAAFVPLEALPLTPNGKIDRRALPAPETVLAVSEFAAPEGTVEQLTAQIWGQLFDRERVGANDHFFELGGHSLLAMRLISRLREAFRVELPLRNLFETPTVAGLSRTIEAGLRDPAAGPASPIVRAAGDRERPLSFAQQRLWFIDQLEGGSAAYNLFAALSLRGRLEVAVLTRALSEIIRRHEVLRTAFELVDGGPVPVIHPPASALVAVVDLRAVDAARRRIEVRRWARDQARRPFDLTRGPLLRTVLLRLEAGAPDREEHVLLLAMHHIAGDDWSVTVLTRELGVLYEAFLGAGPSPLPELPIQYADYAHWQRQWLRGEVMERQLAYWRERLAGAPPVLELPTDRPRPTVQSSRGGRRELVLSPSLAGALLTVSREQSATLFMTLLAAFQALLRRYSGHPDVSVGTAVTGRNRIELEPLIGFFVNMLVIRTDLSGASTPPGTADRDPAFAAVLAQVRERVLEADAHQELPFEKLVEELQPKRSLSHTPLYQVVFSFENRSPEPLRLPGLAGRPLVIEDETAKFDLALLMVDTGAEVSGHLEYSADLFDRVTIRRLLGHFRNLLEGIVADPGCRLSSLALLEPAELQQLQVEWSGRRTSYPRDALISELFAAQVARTPEAVALTCGSRSLSYRELDRRAARLAGRLRAAGVGPEVLVGLLLERSPELILAMLAILKAGGAYVALDVDDPMERLALMLADLGIPVVLSERPLPPGLTEVNLRVDSPVAGEEREAVPEPSATAASLAYVMFTSGSTGRPKGVGVSQRSIVRLVRETDFAHFGPEEVFLQLAPNSFDAATLEIWGPLLNGGRLVVMPPGKPSLEELGQALARHGVTTLWLTAGLFHQMVESQLASLGGIRQLLAGGDVLSVAAVRRVLAELPGCTLINGYGPTENTTFTCCHPLSGGDPPGGSVSIGRPIANTWVYVLDAAMEPVPPGVVGELCVSGDGLARGYLNWPAPTAERFVPNPLAGTVAHEPAGGRLYRTGDLVRYLPGGNLEFLGRNDHQVKVRGFRIELDEIESTLGRFPAIRECLVLAREHRPGDQRLVAYVVSRNGAPEVSELRGFLKEKLPDYMMPAAFVFLERFPLTPNGKVDRRALPAPDSERPELEQGFVAPRTPLERELAAIWAEVLGIERVGVYDDFFELGGHSLLATRILSRIQQTSTVKLPLRSLFENPTVAEIARLLADAEAPPSDEEEKIARALEQLEELSDEEVKALLSGVDA